MLTLFSNYSYCGHNSGTVDDGDLVYITYKLYSHGLDFILN